MDYLKNKVAVITGVSKGIGAAITRQLLERGVTVIGWGLNPPADDHPQLHFISCDVSDEKQVEAAFSATKELVSAIDVLINNAGFGYFSLIENFSIERWDKMYAVNVRGVMLVTQKVVPVMKLNQAGHIVNISSIAGRTGMAYGSGYNSSKFAVSGFSESLFNELRKEGIKVTTVFPGSTNTHFFDEIPGFDAHENMVSSDELAASVIHVLDTSPNYLIREIEIRPLNSKPPES